MPKEVPTTLKKVCLARKKRQIEIQVRLKKYPPPWKKGVLPARHTPNWNSSTEDVPTTKK